MMMKVPGLIISKFLMIFTLMIFSFFQPSAKSQGTNYIYEKVQLGDVKNLLVWLALHPDGKTLAVSSHQSFPLYMYNLDTKQVVNQFDVGNWYAGSRADYSSNGKYILLQQLFYMDWSFNKDKQVNFEVFDATSGKSMLNFGDYHDAKLMPDEQNLLTLSGTGKVAVHDIQTRKELRSFDVPQATNAVAVSADGRLIAVSHKTNIHDLKDDPSYKNNKKNQPILEKYKQQISVYDFESFNKLYTIDAYYDIIYRLQYTGDGDYLMIYSIPHTKLQGPTGRKSYVEFVDARTGEPLRISFGSLLAYEPDFKLSHNKKFFGIISMNTKYPELHLYDFQSNEMLKRFELSYRLFEKASEGEFPTDGRASFIFLPGDEEIMINYGNRIIKWKIEL